MQLDLRFLEISVVETNVWNQLDDEQRAIVIETLARMIAQVGLSETNQEGETDD